MKIKTTFYSCSLLPGGSRRILAADWRAAGRRAIPGSTGRCFRKTALILAIGGTFAFGPLTAQAFEATVSGQVNRALMWADDGIVSETHHVDNDNSGTRFRFTGTSADVMPGVKAGLLFEVEFQSNASNEVSQTTRTTTPGFLERHFDLFFTGDFGKISIGQGDGAANGGIEVDLSGTAVVQWSGAQFIGGAIQFRDGAGGFGPTIAQTTDHQDFESRYDRLRYDTPAFGPVRLALSTGVNGGEDTNEVALWYSGDLGAGGRLAGALGFSSQDRAPGPGSVDDETVGGSISWLSPWGLNVTVAASNRDLTAGREGKFSYFKVGYKWGRHAVVVDYGKGDDQAADGDEADFFGIGYVNTPTKWADLYAAAKVHSLDRPGANFDDITIVMVGSRVKF